MKRSATYKLREPGFGAIAFDCIMVLYQLIVPKARSFPASNG
ncbi:MAG TPA: hypothetical protein V6D09_14930 [Leptolyngbyaceae cyanobacterium]